MANTSQTDQTLTMESLEDPCEMSEDLKVTELANRVKHDFTVCFPPQWGNYLDNLEFAEAAIEVLEAYISNTSDFDYEKSRGPLRDAWIFYKSFSDAERKFLLDYIMNF